jgi:hypothetical protein
LSSESRQVAVLLAFCLVLNIAGLWWGLPQSGSWAPDEIPPSRVHDGMSHLFSNGWHDKYPLFHFMLLAPIVLPFSFLHDRGIVRFTPASGNTLLLILMRLLSTALSAGLVYGVYRAGRTLLGHRAGLLSAAMTAFIVPLPYYAKTANVDVPYLFWFAASLFFFVRLLDEGRRRDYVLFGVAAALSVCTKDQAYGLYILTPLIILWNDARRSRVRRAAASYAWALSAAAGAFAVGNNLLFDWSGFVSHVRLITGQASRDFATVPATAAGQLRLLGQAAKQVRFCLGWPLLLLCLAGLVVVLFDRSAPFALKVLPLLGLSYHVAYVSVIRYSYDRFQLPVAILLTFFGAALLDRFLRSGRAKWKPAAVALLLGCGAFRAASVDRLMLADSRYGVERWMEANVPRSASLGLATNREYLPRLKAYPRASDLSLSLEDFAVSPKPDYVLVCPAFGRSFPPDSAEGRFFAGFASLPPGYRLALDGKTRLRLFPLSFEGIGTNLAAISPDVQIWAKRDPGESLAEPRR